jgi:hypothetical protein
MTSPAAALDPGRPAPAAVWEDLVDVFTQPRAVFARRRDGRFWLALVAFTVIGALSLFAARPVLQLAVERQVSAQIAKIQADPNVPAAQKEAVAGRMRGMADSPLGTAFGAVFLPVAVFATALTLWLVAKLFGSGAGFGQALAVTAIGGIPRAVLGLVVAGGSAIAGRQAGTIYGATASPAAFLGPDASPVVAALLSRLDLGVLWHTALLGLGIAVMGRLVRRGGDEVEGTMTLGRGLAAAAVVWVLATAVAVVQALQQAPTA